MCVSNPVDWRRPYPSSAAGGVKCAPLLQDRSDGRDDLSRDRVDGLSHSSDLSYYVAAASPGRPVASVAALLVP